MLKTTNWWPLRWKRKGDEELCEECRKGYMECAGDLPKVYRESISFWQRKYMDVVEPGWNNKSKKKV